MIDDFGGRKVAILQRYEYVEKHWTRLTYCVKWRWLRRFVYGIIEKEEQPAMKEELLKGLTEEQIAKVRTCGSAEELLAIAKEEGIELTDEQLEVVSGGCTQDISGNKGLYDTCPKCGTYRWHQWLKKSGDFQYLECPSCGCKFWVKHIA